MKVGSVEVHDQAIQFKFHLSTGPGGQNVNKVATAVELRFNVAQSGLSESINERVLKQGKSHVNTAGELVIHATRHRSQKRNKEEALLRLVNIIEAAQTPPKPRIPTRPSARAKQVRLDQKRKTSEKKQSRKNSLD
ncbi:MAG: alternative ribosome rescue aminoacyl-tRNA hydrolase ArfB [Gammaproteobacteria bacterium]|nr:alternative ribosome rescue aminoacyl-tRNA hydrolase ArfB [Gammaproteobacteria bacterium]